MVKEQKKLADFVLGRMLVVWADQPADSKASLWESLKLAPRAIRLTGFILTWAVVMRSHGVEVLSPEAYWPEGYDSRASTYRRLKEFHELFPGLSIDTLALLVAEQNGGLLSTISPGQVGFDPTSRLSFATAAA